MRVRLTMESCPVLLGGWDETVESNDKVGFVNGICQRHFGRVKPYLPRTSVVY